jgi:hypothetical protein
MRVDEAGADDFSVTIDHLISRISRADLVARSDSDEVAVFNRDRTVFDNADIAHFSSAFGFATRSTRHQLAYIRDKKVRVHRKGTDPNRNLNIRTFNDLPRGIVCFHSTSEVILRSQYILKEIDNDSRSTHA